VSEQNEQTATEAVERPGTWLGVIESHLWAITPETLATIVRLAESGQFGQRAEIEAARQRGRPKSINGGVAKVALKGTLAPPHPILQLFFGLRNPLEEFLEDTKEALADPDVGAVVVEVDSPGGVIDGIPEAAAALRAMKGSKPIIAHANTMAASAAYWIASQADEMVMTPSGAVGSIGVYAAHRDMSGAMKLMGVETTLIKAGRFKTAGNPWEPLSEEAREHIQEDVDHFYGLFTADVAKGRGVKVADVKGGYGEGRVLNSKRALEENLVDRVETLGETIARLNSRSRGNGSIARAEAEEPEPTTLEAAEADEPEPESDEKHAVLDALFEDDPVLAAHRLDKIAPAPAAA
jgi:capsid assembly protease